MVGKRLCVKNGLTESSPKCKANETKVMIFDKRVVVRRRIYKVRNLKLEGSRETRQAEPV